MDTSVDTVRLRAVLDCLKRLRIGLVREEYELQNRIAEELNRDGIPFTKEYRLAPRNRIDFLVDGGIGIEVKKGKPVKSQTVKQLERYTSFDEIEVMILVVERSLCIPSEINGKKCFSFGLNRNWGIAL